MLIIRGKYEYLLLFTVSLFYIFFFTINIPFYWWDNPNIDKFSGGWQHDSLTYGSEFAFRPLENTVYFLFLHIFGLTPIPFHILKAAATALVILFIYFFVKKNTEDKKIAFMAAFFFLTTTTVLQSVSYIYDFEIIVQAFLLMATYIFFQAWDEEKPSWKKITAFIFIICFALLTKESAKILIGIIFIFIIVTKWKKFLYFSLPLLLLLLLAYKPGLLLGVQNPQYSMFSYILNWYALQNLLLFLNYFFIATFGVLIILFTFLIMIFNEKKEENKLLISFSLLKKYIQEMNQPLLFFGLWFFITAGLTVVVPMTDRRYAIVPFLPFTIFSFIFIGRNYKKYLLPKKGILLFLLVLLFISFMTNIVMDIKYKYGFGNFIILVDETHTFTEQNYENSTFIYTDTIAHYYNFFGLSKTNNKYLEYHHWNISKPKKNIFFFALRTPLQTKEKNKTTLEKTFVKGPQCFQLYKLQEEEIKEIALEKNREEKNKEDIWTYSFPEETDPSYCSIIIETRFLIPEDIEMTIVGKTRNVTEILSVPVGKHISCEYLCPSFREKRDTTEKIQGIQIKGKKGFLNDFYSAKLHWIEKE